MYKKIDQELIEKKADFITEKYTLEDKIAGYVDIIEIAKSNGFLVGNANISDDSDGFIAIDENEGTVFGMPTSKLIAVNSNKSIEWKRFIIAHELGHYFLHYVDNASEYDGMYAMREHKKGKDDMENDADFFAACLLMPRNIFTKRFHQLKEQLKEKEDVYNLALLLSKEFLVTLVMAERRIQELGLV